MAREFYEVIKAHAGNAPDQPAVIDGESVLSYSRLLEQVEKFSGALGGLTLSPQSKLGILCSNQKEYVVAFLGALLKGLPAVPLNPLLTPEDLAFIVRDAEIENLVVDGIFVKPETAALFKPFKNTILAGTCAVPDLLGEGAQSFEDFLLKGDRLEGLNRHNRAPGLPDAILYTSGTTARPKGAMLDETQFHVNSMGFSDRLQFSDAERAIVALPLFHSFGNMIALTILRAGGALILLRQFAPKAILHAIAQHKATVLPLVPTIYAFLVDLYGRGGYDVSSLRICISGGASLPETLLRRVESALGVTVIEGYGLTETSPVISVNTIAEGSVPGSVGPPLPNVQLKIVDESGGPVKPGDAGEIWVRGPTVMKGYWKRPQETREVLTADGWFKTGDLGHLDEKGRLYISAGRKKDLIIRAGENVSPLAIENALMSHPAVVEAAAVGIPHPRKGEQVRACVVLREGAAADEHELKEFCRKKLPAFMVPDNFKFYDALPKTPTGKILKSRLRGE
ncbi:MAG: class I adenylate-forming enzyme family protein [Nitrospinales bacterium]